MVHLILRADRTRSTSTRSTSTTGITRTTTTTQVSTRTKIVASARHNNHSIIGARRNFAKYLG
jgi:hypothetical protein